MLRSRRVQQWNASPSGWKLSAETRRRTIPQEMRMCVGVQEPQNKQMDHANFHNYQAMNTQHPTECSWCNQESGATSKPGTSHTICPKHKAQLLAEYRRDCESEQVARTFSDLERARAYRYPAPVRNDILEAHWNTPERTVWSALKWVGFGVLCGLGAILMVLAMAWEGLP